MKTFLIKTCQAEDTRINGQDQQGESPCEHPRISVERSRAALWKQANKKEDRTFLKLKPWLFPVLDQIMVLTPQLKYLGEEKMTPLWKKMSHVAFIMFYVQCLSFYTTLISASKNNHVTKYEEINSREYKHTCKWSLYWS